MDPTVTSLLEGPVGAVVRIAALGALAAVALWVFTGIRVLGDDDRPRRSGPFRRLALGALSAVALGAVAVDPVAVIDTVHGWIDSLVDHLS